jgi:glutamate-5-semialdehyde dehydrogenase
VQFVDRPEHEAIDLLVAREGRIDLVIPRGGEALIRRVTERSRVPVIKHYKGVCHLYVDASADLPMAVKVAVNSKVQRPGVCNALEKLLVHADVAAAFLPALRDAMPQVELRGCRTLLLRHEGRDGGGLGAESSFGPRHAWSAPTGVLPHQRYGSSHRQHPGLGRRRSALRVRRGLGGGGGDASTRLNGEVFGLGAEISQHGQAPRPHGPAGTDDVSGWAGSGDLRA